MRLFRKHVIAIAFVSLGTIAGAIFVIGEELVRTFQAVSTTLDSVAPKEKLESAPPPTVSLQTPPSGEMPALASSGGSDARSREERARAGEQRITRTRMAEEARRLAAEAEARRAEEARRLAETLARASAEATKAAPVSEPKPTAAPVNRAPSSGIPAAAPEHKAAAPHPVATVTATGEVKLLGSLEPGAEQQDAIGVRSHDAVTGPAAGMTSSYGRNAGSTAFDAVRATPAKPGAGISPPPVDAMPIRTRPAPSPDETISRFPTMEAPDTVTPGEAFPVQVWLTEELITPEVKVAPGGRAKVTSEGALAMMLPRSASGNWSVRVVLTSPHFELKSGKRSQILTLPRKGDSTPALFMLAAKAVGSKATERKIRVTLWHEGNYIAGLSRVVTVVPDMAIAGRARPAREEISGATGGGSGRHVSQAARSTAIDDKTVPPDLTVHVLYADPEKMGRGQVIIASPHFNPPSRLIVKAIDTPESAIEWLNLNYERFVDTLVSSAGDRSGKDLKELAIPMLRGFGRELYRRFAPAEFKRVFWSLYRRDRLRSIQIFSNNPVLPWELMRPFEEVSASGTASDKTDFLGISFRVGRWHASDSDRQLDRPVQSIRFKEIMAVAPHYNGQNLLPFQSEEIDGLRHMAGFREIGGLFRDVKALISKGPEGIIHFTGHGVIRQSPKGVPWYEIQLEDAALDVLTWRGLAAQAAGSHAFYFLNACDTGQARSIANFVEGWAPAVLELGASGYIGGLWPLADRSAARFSSRFYSELLDGLKSGRPLPVASALQKARKLFYETGDPTYLAYTFYGDVNFRFLP